MKRKDTPDVIDPYQKWAEWSPKKKKKKPTSADLGRIVSAIVMVTSAVHVMGLPGL